MGLLLGGSVIAVALMVACAWALRLGGGRIASETEAAVTAENILSGFESARAVVGTDGQAALVLGTDGSLAVLKVHGARVAGRRLKPPFTADPVPEGLRIATGETRFGRVLVRGLAAIPTAYS